ncbi:tripartite-type tricarboxylate transporter receptor subunit TctC [Variovorax boronicumulans]|uniref:Bug family tripartite tricarboxylate transporter substrate binding protein n=1 Tax=Variovorax boronicumulans TaxID=436515 RepID=UPI002475FF8C|nr:tripartite tricarboxylate transporter substrate binding protein [Variovorax boronicumulans]MDH6166306.1 tripartite-type tricarboxylate transporter receptor subunit TctC [Variovorax boronicumulans]
MSPSSFITRRSAAAWLALGAVALPLTSLAASPAAFPEKGRTIRIVLGLAAGGASDSQARFVANKLGEVLQTPVIVENRPGASFILATEEVIRAAPDGYTFMYAPSSVVAQNPQTLAQVRYDPFKDLTPISLGARGPLVLTVHTSVPARNVQELVAYIKANPGKMSYASFGTGTSSHIYGEAFARQAGLDVVHVPYKGGADAAKDFLAGRVQYYFDAAPNAIQNTATGKVRMLAVAAPKRSAMLPDVPTMTEQGVSGVDMASWLGFYGPAHMPAPVVTKLNAALAQVLAMPATRDFFHQGAYEAESSTPQQLAELTRTTYDQWAETIRKLGLTKQ